MYTMSFAFKGSNFMVLLGITNIKLSKTLAKRSLSKQRATHKLIDLHKLFFMSIIISYECNVIAHCIRKGVDIGR